jgi:DNA topoisomerase-3
VQLIVAEKPSVARDLARVLGVRPTGQHCFEGDARVITWCVGHLVELDEPAAYDPRWKAWRLDTLPMLPAEFRLRPSRHATAQLRAVVRLLADRRFTSVVNACDAGREGELIFRYLYQFAGKGPPIRRLWISSLTDEAIRKGFAALRPSAQLDALGDAARSRSEADWLVGMNATRAITVRGRGAGHTALYSIGRVQTPTLAMLVSREQAIRAFVPRPYWEIRGEFRTAEGQSFTAGWRHGSVARLGTAALADAIATRDTAHGAATDAHGPSVEQIRARTVREPAPLLFDLTSLQRTANRRFGWSAARTLELAQALYERHKILTYPRTDSRHLSSDLVHELPALFAALAQAPEYAAFAGELLAHPPRPSRRVVDDAKVHDHHAIIPTGKPVRQGALDRDEQRLFDLVARRFLAAFYPDAEFAITEAWIRVGAALAGAPAPAFAPTEATPARTPATGGEAPVLDRLPPEPDRYLARGRVRLAAGWQAVAGIDGTAPAARDRDRDRDDPDGEPASLLPPLAQGQPLDGAFSPIAKHTTPPHRYTEATLLGAMESAGKEIDDEALRAAMKDVGLGTPATRAAIIETLLKRDYIVRTKQHLTPTAVGIALIEALPVASLASPELTGAWEARLARIARGGDSRAAFMADIARYVAEMVDTIRASNPPAAPTTPEAPPIGRCPRCGAGVVERAREFACTGDCSFAMQKRVAGRAITEALAGVLLERRRSQVLRGFRSKAGKPFSAMLVLDDDGALRFEFAGGDRAPPPITELACPRCHQGTLITGARGWGCSRWRDGCRFVVWFETAGRRLSAAQLRDLVTRGKTRKARFLSDQGLPLDGRLVLAPAADGGSARLEPA